MGQLREEQAPGAGKHLSGNTGLALEPWSQMSWAGWAGGSRGAGSGAEIKALFGLDVQPRAAPETGGSCPGGFCSEAGGKNATDPFPLLTPKAPWQCVNSQVTRPTAKGRPVYPGKAMNGETSRRTKVKAPLGWVSKHPPAMCLWARTNSP